jgi:hypothetical protein
VGSPTPSVTEIFPVIASPYINEKNSHVEGLVLCQVSTEEPPRTQDETTPTETLRKQHDISREYDIKPAFNGLEDGRIDISNPSKDEDYSTTISRVARDYGGGHSLLTKGDSDTVLESENLPPTESRSIETTSSVTLEHSAPRKEMSNLRQCFSSPGPLSRSQDIDGFQNRCFDDMWPKVKGYLQWESFPKSVETTAVQERAAEDASNNLVTDLHECESMSGNDLRQKINQRLLSVKLEKSKGISTPVSDQRQDLGTSFSKNKQTDPPLQRDNGYNPRVKEKKKKDKPLLDTIQRRGVNHKSQTSGSTKNARQYGSSEFSISSSLGSLSSYMETRCKASKRQKTHKSNYFTTPTPKSDLPEKNIVEETIDALDRDEVPCNIMDTGACCPSLSCGFPPLSDCPIFIISTTLLKADVQIIRDLESLTPMPTLIFRDYGTIPNREPLVSQDLPTSSLSQSLKPLMEADIIVSPSTGIIITTSQEISQLRLPGHKPAHLPQCGFPKFDSPLRERIALLANRYEQLYILIRFPWTCSNDSVEKSKIAATDPKTLLSIQSLTAFCSSLSEYATVALVMQSSCHHDTTKWILSITNKQAVRFREQQLIPSQNDDNTSVLVNTDTQDMGYRFSFLHEETQWELFLRQAGFNPFAAQAVLGILKSETEKPITDALVCLEDSQGDGPNNRAFPSGLSLFMELRSQERYKMFANVIGPRVLRRVESVIDKDWQLSWATYLNTSPDP